MNVNVNKQSEKKREDKATRRETRYEKWKRSRKAKSGWIYWCCCGIPPTTSENNMDTTPLTDNNSIA